MPVLLTADARLRRSVASSRTDLVDSYTSPVTTHAPHRHTLPWREIAKWALLGTVLIGLWVLVDVERSGRTVLNFIQPGNDGPSAAAFHHDFPSAELPPGLGLDGQQFYAIARNPWHPTEVAPLLDRPRYRLQRPLLAWFAWLLQPTGGGYGLAWAFVLVGVAAIFAGSLATGALAVQLGGRPWLAMAFALTPGAWFSLRASVADALALALVIAALALSYDKRTRAAVVCGIGAVLAKEVIIVVLVGWAISRRRQDDYLLAAIPAAVAAAWFVALRIMIPGHEQVGELAAPFVGWRDAWLELWRYGQQLWGFTAAAVSVVVGAAALIRRGLRHPLGWAIALCMAIGVLSNGDVIGNNYGSTRSLMPALVLGLVAFFTPGVSQFERSVATNQPPTGSDTFSTR